MSEVIQWLKTVEYSKNGDRMHLANMDVRMSIENYWTGDGLAIRRFIENDKVLKVTNLNNTLDAISIGCNTCEEDNKCGSFCKRILENRNLETKWFSSWSPSLCFSVPYEQSVVQNGEYRIVEMSSFAVIRDDRKDECHPLAIGAFASGPSFGSGDEGGVTDPIFSMKSRYPDILQYPPNDLRNVNWLNVLIYPQRLNVNLKRKFIKWFGDRPEEDLTDFDRKLLGMD